MAKIGTFTKTDGGFTGTLETLTIQTQIDFKAVEKTGEKAPDFRVYHEQAEIGAAWAKKSKDKKPFLSVTLDDPSFTAPVRAVLLKANGGNYQLIWNR